LNIVVQDLKNRLKTMVIPLRLRVAHEMKNLQAEVKTIQEGKNTRQDQLEPL